MTGRRGPREMRPRTRKESGKEAAFEARLKADCEYMRETDRLWKMKLVRKPGDWSESAVKGIPRDVLDGLRVMAQEGESQARIARELELSKNQLKRGLRALQIARLKGWLDRSPEARRSGPH